MEFSQELRNKFAERHRHLLGPANEFRCNRIIPGPFQAETGKDLVELRQVAWAERQKPALHQSQGEATQGPAFARFATGSSQKELGKCVIIPALGKEFFREP